ncbi:LysR family transcriptional regulator [Hydrogenophaga sp. OTU3427]|uniref:LysR family transcriptional regulator n=1 Tax=Hydrogenophaga sp. OTU3427 TaxID=3043856 RepID=UPI00313DCEF4
MNDIHSQSLDLNLLSVFDAMFRERSVTRAAHGLGLTQSAMSHALNRLRTFFDDPLFVKSGDAMLPTRKAETLRQPVLDVMSLVRQQILSSARFDPQTARRVFTLCMTDMGEFVFLPPLLQRLRKEAPHCSVRTLQVPIEQIEGLLSQGDADLAVGSIRSAPEGLYQQRLFMHSFVTIVNTHHPVKDDRLTLQHFQDMPHVVVSLTGRANEAYDSALEAHGVQRQVLVTTPHFLIVPLLLERHPDLIATVPQELATVYARYGTVRVMEPPVPLPTFALNQHWHPRFHNDPAIVWLRELMKHTFEKYPEIVVDAPAAPPRPKRPRK